MNKQQTINAVAEWLRGKGWVVTQSDGPADLWCARNDRMLHLVQVRPWNENKPWKRFGPSARRKLLDEAVATGGVALAAFYRSREQPVLCYSNSWPDD